MKAIHEAECGDELESFDSVEDLFKSWEDSSTKDEKLDSSDRRRSLNRKTKEHILSRLLNESAGKISRVTDAAHSQDFLYGKDAMKKGTFAHNCLIARRLSERGVPFVQLFHRGWDQHNNLPKQIRGQTHSTNGRDLSRNQRAPSLY